METEEGEEGGGEEGGGGYFGQPMDVTGGAERGEPDLMNLLPNSGNPMSWLGGMPPGPGMEGMGAGASPLPPDGLVVVIPPGASKATAARRGNRSKATAGARARGGSGAKASTKLGKPGHRRKKSGGGSKAAKGRSKSNSPPLKASKAAAATAVRGGYKCAKCGLPKRGHICAYNSAETSDMGTCVCVCVCVCGLLSFTCKFFRSS